MIHSDTLRLFLLSPLLLLAACALSIFLTRFCICILPYFQMIDVPHGRHQHDKPIPRGGGIAIIVSFVLVSLAYMVLVKISGGSSGGMEQLLIQLGPAVLVLGGLGVLDDRYELSSKTKLIVQLLVALYFYFTGAGVNTLLGFHLPVYIALPITVCWVIGIINAFNLIDGMDGIAAGLASISSFAIAIWYFLMSASADFLILQLIFCGSCLGFLRYNFSPARIFMGDTGSLFIGTFFAYFSMLESSKAMTLTALLVPVLAMGIPIFDVFLAIVRRIYRKYILREPGAGIMVGDRDHLHHRIQEQTRDQRKTAYYLYFLGFLLVIGSMAAALVSDLLQTLSFGILLVIMFVVVRAATIEFYDTAALISEGIRIPRHSFMLTAVHPVIDILLVLAAYCFTSVLFQRNLNFSPFTLKQALFYVAPFPMVLALSGIYRTYWLRSGLRQYFRLLLILILASVLVLGVALGFNLYEFGEDRDRISMMREFFSAYSLMGCGFILAERFLLCYLSNFAFMFLAGNIAAREKALSRTVIYGGGLFCRLFLSAEYSAGGDTPNRKFVGIIDDNPCLRNLNVYGLNVLGTSEDLDVVLKRVSFDEVIIALKAITPEVHRRIEDFCAANHIKLAEFRCGLTDILKD